MAVYTEIARHQAEAFLQFYDIGKLVDLVGIEQGVENTNYFLETSQGRFILTIYEKRVNPNDLPFFLELLKHLTARGFPCPRPVSTRDAKLLSQIDGKPAAIVTFLEGKSHRKLSTTRCMALGESMAMMHLAADGFSLQRTNSLGVDSWHGLFQRSRIKADCVAHGLCELIEGEISRLSSHWPHDLPKGIIHADLFPDNVFYVGTKVSGVIDFYFACNDCLAYDVAICLNAWCFETDGQFNITKAQAMLKAYNAIRPLSSAEIGALPVLAAGAALRFLLTRLHDWLHQIDGALVKPKDPLEYWRKLRFHQSVLGPEAYGLGS